MWQVRWRNRAESDLMHLPVVPAQAGIQEILRRERRNRPGNYWIPAFAGTTVESGNNEVKEEWIMQNRYVGDIGDFANNGLLRWLIGMTGPTLKEKERLQLGVVQYAHHDEPSNGGHIGYLSLTPENVLEFQKCDTQLYCALKDLVFKDKRTIKAAQRTFKRKEILPPNTLYYDKELPDCSERSLDKRKETRDDWLNSAFNATRAAKIVFFNPDNGIANDNVVNPISPTSKRGTKYVFMNDLKCFAKNGNSLVIYHHLGQGHQNHDQRISYFAKRLQCNLQLPVWCFSYTAWASRAYFIALQPKDKLIIEKRLCSFLQSDWCKGERKLFKFKFAISPLPCSP